MNLKEMTIEQLNARKAAIAKEIDAPEANLDALEEEVRAINEELEARKKAAKQREDIRKSVAVGAGVVVNVPVEEPKAKNVDEIRNSTEYIDAFAKYIKTGKDTECRSLLSENATTGTVPVPELVYEIVKTAWDNEGIMRLVRKAYVRGNLKVGFEISASEAAVHTEGSAAVSEETLVLGVVELKPESIKKWISVSDEALDMTGEAFLRYIYDELAYQIAKKAAKQLIAKIEACGTVSTTTAPAVPAITATTVAVGTVAKAIAQLSDSAANPVIMMNKLTWGDFKEAQYANNYNVDPFEGLPVVFNNSIASFDAATTGVTYAIVGDLGEGALANMPNGDEITFKFDDLTLATSDMVKVIGREFVGLGVIAPKAFCKVKK